jgi:hypothetical protein
VRRTPSCPRSRANSSLFYLYCCSTIMNAWAHSCIFWADLTPVSLEAAARRSEAQTYKVVSPAAFGAPDMDHGDKVGLYIFEHLVGENIRRYPTSLTSLECRVSELVHSDTCPRPTTGLPAAVAAGAPAADLGQPAGEEPRSAPLSCIIQSLP